jgi:hypothetical protein
MSQQLVYSVDERVEQFPLFADQPRRAAASPIVPL